MACELRLLAKLNDVHKWKKYLFAGEKDDTNWLHKCVIAVSPIADKILVAHGPALVLLNLQWDKGSDEKSCPQLVVHRQWDSVEELKIQDFITSAAFLPIAPLDNYSHGCPDWTCIALGFSSGYLRFFTENMDLVAADQMHPEPLLHIRATGQKEASKDSGQSTEAVYAVYPSVLCSLTGFSLLQTLRSRRKEVALTRARSQPLAPQVALEVKKYDFPVQPVRDACFVSGGSVNQFDHLLNASLVDGFHGNYRPSPPQHSIIASTGSYTWLQFQTTMEGIAAPIELTDVALQVMSKLPGWLGINLPKTKQTVVRPSEKLASKCRLLDRRRDGRAVFPSPDGSLLAVTDSLGRVTLVDVRTSTAIRMWKGYRDAECGYLEVEEELPKSRHRHRHQSDGSKSDVARKLLLLVIYAPKKGLIELFPLRHGPRVAALTVSKNGRLVYTSHGLIGYTSVSRKSSRPVVVSVAFLSEEGLMDITVPFHCALLDSSARAKDLHHLKQLKVWLKETERSEEELLTEIKAMCLKLETDDVRLLTVDYLSSVKYVTPSALCSALNVFLENASDNDIVVTAGHRRNLLTLCKQLRNVVNFYTFLQNLNHPPEAEASGENPTLTEALLLSESEATIFVEFVQNMQLISGPKRETKVKFYSSPGQSLPQFLQSLDVSENGPIMAKPNLSEDDYKSLGELMFSRICLLPSQLDDWKKQAKLSNVSIEFLSRCLLAFWLQRPVANVEQDVHIFLLLLKAVVSVSDDTLAASDNNVESPWWTEMRSVISKCPKALTALVVAVCCRSVSMQCEQEMELSRVNTCKELCNADNDWENVSADTWQWDLLITHLEDVALLNTVLSYKPASVRKLSTENNEVSLTDLISAGEEAVSEKVSKWLVQFKISPNLLVDKSDVEFLQNSSQIIEDNVSNQKTQKLFKGGENLVLPLVEVAEESAPESETETSIIKYLTLLKKRFPYSLTSSALISHLAWEVMTSWQQNLPSINLLQSAIEYLKIIPSTHLKAGVCVLAWATYLKMHFEAVLRLISKVGKLPTDTLCMRELGIPRDKIAPFLESSTLLLTIILDACAERPQIKFIRRHETLWRGTGTGLVAVAISRPPPVEEMVLIHYHVNIFFHMASALELKEKNLFCSLLDSLKSDLFGELMQRPTTSIHNTGLIKNLSRFLLRAVSASVETIRQVEADDGFIRLDTEVSNYWLRMCFALASAWRIPLDELRIQHVCELYSHGFDRLAEEAFENVKDLQKLYSPLLVIVGQRINAVLASSSAPEQILSSLNPSLTSWLKDLGDGIRETRVDLNDTELLVTRLLQIIPEDSKADIQRAVLIAENLPGLRDS